MEGLHEAVTRQESEYSIRGERVGTSSLGKKGGVRNGRSRKRRAVAQGGLERETCSEKKDSWTVPLWSLGEKKKRLELGGAHLRTQSQQVKDDSAHHGRAGGNKKRRRIAGVRLPETRSYLSNPTKWEGGTVKARTQQEKKQP